MRDPGKTPPKTSKNFRRGSREKSRGNPGLLGNIFWLGAVEIVGRENPGRKSWIYQKFLGTLTENKKKVMNYLLVECRWNYWSGKIPDCFGQNPGVVGRGGARKNQRKSRIDQKFLGALNKKYQADKENPGKIQMKIQRET